MGYVCMCLAFLAVLCAAFGEPKRVKNEKSVGEWFMVFRAKSGNDKSVIDAYLSPLGTNEYNSLPGCTSVVGSEVCNGHYRHSVLDRWRILGIKRVKIEFYKNGIPVAYVTFNGRGTDNVNWFDRSKVISSSWTDVTVNGNYFSIFGVRTGALNRRFYMNKSWDGCPRDDGWVVVLDSEGVCEYERGHTNFPVFLYSPVSTSTNFIKKNSVQADVMAIYVDSA